MKNLLNYTVLVSTFLFLVACGSNPNSTGLEFAPQMYVSKPYEPYSQVEGVKNAYNPMGMNLRHPAPNTIARRNFNTAFTIKDSTGKEVTMDDIMYYNISAGPDGLKEAAEKLKNPVPLNDQVLEDGKVLYARYCAPCHGAQGDGQGKVGQKYAGVANYAGITRNNGHIYHVITYGKNRMWPHGSQVTPVERWKIVHWVNKLQTDLTGEGEEEESTAETAADSTATTEATTTDSTSAE